MSKPKETPLHKFKVGDEVFQIESGIVHIVKEIKYGNMIVTNITKPSATNEILFYPYDSPENKAIAHTKHEEFKASIAARTAAATPNAKAAAAKAAREAEAAQKLAALREAAAAAAREAALAREAAAAQEAAHAGEAAVAREAAAAIAKAEREAEEAAYIREATVARDAANAEKAIAAAAGRTVIFKEAQLPPLIDQLRKAYISYTEFLSAAKIRQTLRADGKLIATFDFNVHTHHLEKNLIEHLNSIQVLKGGAITYLVTTTAPLNTLLFEGNPYKPIPKADNVLIVGGGPNGLYLSILLKVGNPDLIVNVLENRVDGEGKRSLTRLQQLRLTSLCLSDLYRETVKVSPEIAELLEVKDDRLYCSGNAPKLDPFNLISGKKLGRTPYTNEIEYYLANKAQEVGVNIFHEQIPDNDFYPKYTNGNTLAVFDATGGRLHKDMTGIDRVRSVSGAQNWTTTELVYRGAYNVYFGFLPPNNAFRMINNIPYIAVGDTSLRTDYILGRGLEFNWWLILRYALNFTYFYRKGAPPAANGAAAGAGGGAAPAFIGGRRRTRKPFLPPKYFAGLKKTARTRRRKEIARFGAMHWKDPRAYVGFATDVGVKGKQSNYTAAWHALFPGADSLEAKAKATGVPLWAIRESYNRGMAAWRTGHRPGATEQQWGYARVHSFLLCGKTHHTTDSDIVQRAKAASAAARTFWKRACRLSPVAFKN